MLPARRPTSFPALLALAFVAALPAQSSNIEQKVDAAVAESLNRPGAVGLSVGVAWKDAQVAKGYGIADAEFDGRANAATMFRIGSITKQFTAALVMKQIEAGKVALDDPLQKHVPDFPTGGRPVTVRQLLDHTSGIPSYTELGSAWIEKQPLELTHGELLGLVTGKPLDFEPGTDWHYTNTGYYLLGVLLEKVTGKSYAQLVVDDIATPCGLSRTRYDSNVDLIKNRAQGYEFRNGMLSNDEPLGTSQPGAAGALLSTGADLVRWSQALVAGKVVSKDSYSRMTTATVLPGGRNTQYGFGLARDQFVGQERIHHGGGINGFNSFLFWLPEKAFHVAVISNGHVDAKSVAEDIAMAVLGLEREKAKDESTTAKQRARLVGSYRIDEIGMNLRVTEKDGKLIVQADGQPAFPVLWQGGEEFRASFDHSVRLVWNADGKAFELHQGGAIVVAKKKQ